MKKILLAGVILIVIAVPFVLVHRVHAAEEAWAHSFGLIESIPAKFRTTQNDTATDLKDWFDRLVPQSLRVRDVISDYLYKQSESPSAKAQPNAYIQKYRAADLDEFAQWLATSPPPVFEYAFRAPDERLPNHLTVMQLQKMLLAAAIARSAGGDRDGAERLLEASWRMNEGLRHSPTLIGQLIAMAVFRLQLGALRKTGVDPARWLPRISGVDFVQPLGNTIHVEVWNVDRAVRENMYVTERYLLDMRAYHADIGEPQPYNPQWLAIVRTPVRWFDLPSVLEADRQMLLAVATAPRSEHIDDYIRSSWKRGGDSWQYIADPDVQKPDWSTAFRRAVRTLAERELTERVLQARGALPIDSSSSIDGAKWLYDGRTLRLSRQMDWGNMAGLNAPLRYELQ